MSIEDILTRNVFFPEDADAVRKCFYNGIPMDVDLILTRNIIFPDDQEVLKSGCNMLLIKKKQIFALYNIFKHEQIPESEQLEKKYQKYEKISNGLNDLEILSKYNDSANKTDNFICENLFKENNAANYGHNLIWKYDSDDNFEFNLPDPSLNHNSGYGYNSGYNYGNMVGGDIKKHDYIGNLYNQNHLSIAQNQKEYFELSRYIMCNDKVFQSNRDANEPTLSMSLFAPPSVIYDNKLTDWNNKYFGNQIRLLLTFKRQFPNGNVRIYFDKYLCDSLEQGSAEINLSNNNLVNNEHEEHYKAIIQNYFDQFIDITSKMQSISFASPLHKFLSYYDLASKSYNDSTTNKIAFDNNKAGEFFVYKFKGNFVEKLSKDSNGKYVEDPNGTYECHQTDGFIGQLVRFISATQSNYQHNDISISRPKHLIFRDGHANSIGYVDAQWIREFNQSCKNNKKQIYMLPSNIFYSNAWHDVATCGTKTYNIAPIAGQLQFANFTDENQFMNNYDLVRSICLAFIVSNNNKIMLLEKLRQIKFAHYDVNNADLIAKRSKMYRYGIDEYILTSFYEINEIKNKTIYNHDIWMIHLLNSKTIEYNTKTILNPIFVAFNVILYYLIKTTKANLNDTNWFDIVTKTESLRNSQMLKNSVEFKKFINVIGGHNDVLDIFVSILPNKYHIRDIVFNQDYNVGLGANDPKKSISEVFKTLIGESYGEDKMDEYFKNVLNKSSIDNIYCSNIAITYPLDWCVMPYVFRKNEHMDKSNCPPEYYATGYYDVKILNDKVILRTPSDLHTIVNEVGKINISNEIYNKSINLNNDELISVVGNNNQYY